MKCTALFLGVLLAASFAPAHAGLFFDQEGMDADCTKKHSLAWCVWDAYGSRGPLRDIPRNKLIPASAHANTNGTGEQLVDLAVAGATAGGLLNVAAGLSRGTDVAMILLGAVLGDGQSHVGRNDLVAWMPADLAGTPDEAIALYEKIVLDATKDAFPGCAFLDITLPPRPANAAYSLKRADLKGYLLTGDACAFDGRTLAQMRDGRYYNDGTFAKIGKAPGWLGGYKAWIFPHGVRILELVEGQRYARRLSGFPVFRMTMPTAIIAAAQPRTNIADEPLRPR